VQGGGGRGRKVEGMKGDGGRGWGHKTGEEVVLEKWRAV